MSTPSKGGRQRVRKSWFSRHQHTLETVGEAIAIDFGWGLLRKLWLMLVVGTASAAITLATSTSTVPAVHPTQPLSTKGAAFITRFEGVRDRPYNDARRACTAGVGHLIHLGPCTAGDIARWTLTPAQATTLLLRDATSATACVHAAVTRKLTVPEDDALIDFTFNVGCGGLRSSQVLRDVNAGIRSTLTSDFSRWSYAGGVYLAGLHTRRLAEAHLYLTGDYGPGIGVYVPTPVQTAAEKLQAKTGYYAWLSWYLGREGWKRYGPHSQKVRPHVAVKVPKGWWRREAAFVKAERR